MEYKQLGTSGVRVAAVGLGTNRFGGKVNDEEVTAILDRALELGINFLDTADIYTDGRSEEAIGKAIKGKRDKLVIATKVGMKKGDGPNDYGASRHHIMESVEASLRRLKTDYIDLYQIHRWDPNTPAEETMRALDDLVRSGKVRYIGASNYASWQLAHSNDLAKLLGLNGFVSIQPHYHMLERDIERELVPYCKQFGVGILPYFPLAGGFLTGKYRQGQEPPEGSRGESSSYVQKYFTEKNFRIIQQLRRFAAKRDHEMVELAISWLLAQPQVSSVIAGVTSVAHVESNARAAAWELTAEEESEVRAILESE